MCILIAIPRFKIGSDMLLVYDTSSLETKNSGLVAIITTSLLYVEDQ